MCGWAIQEEIAIQEIMFLMTPALNAPNFGILALMTQESLISRQRLTTSCQ